MECDRVLLGSCLIICDIIEKQNFQPGEPASPRNVNDPPQFFHGIHIYLVLFIVVVSAVIT